MDGGELSEDSKLQDALEFVARAREVSSIRFHCTRSIAGLPLMPASNPDSRDSVMALLKAACEKLSEEFRGAFCSFEAMEAAELAELVAKEIAFQDF